MDEDFYLKADEFFSKSIPTALTFDDLSLATRYSEVLPRDVRLDTNISDSIKLSIPILSSDMDTVTESDMAIAMALSVTVSIAALAMGVFNPMFLEKREDKSTSRGKTSE